MTIHKTQDFIDNFGKLPSEIKKLYRKQEAIFKADWLNSRLHIITLNKQNKSGHSHCERPFLLRANF